MRENLFESLMLTLEEPAWVPSRRQASTLQLEVGRVHSRMEPKRPRRAEGEDAILGGKKSIWNLGIAIRGILSSLI